MAFRANEEKNRRYEQVLNYLVPKEGTPESKEKARKKVIDIIDEYGPIIDSYPTWHPIVSKNSQHTLDKCMFNLGNWGSDTPLYKGLDHTVLLAHGFITCPYIGANKLVEDINNDNDNTEADIVAERLDISLYNINTQTILVRCDWHHPLSLDRTIPKNIAIPLMLEQEIPFWRGAQCAESWETMRRYFLGAPHGSKSSLFVSQETGQAMKNIWNAIINTGMYGPIKVK
jgi:hypothetical protein